MATEQAQKLRDFVHDIRDYADIESYTQPVIVRRTNPVIAKTTTVVAAKTEPHDLTLPLNVLWIQFDSSKSDYLTVYRRESKATPQNGTTVHTWVKVTQYVDLWEDQLWDSGDDILPNTSDASTGALGIVRLTVTPTNPGDPVAIGEGDPTLTNARDPLPHDEMHDEVPATRLATTGRAVVIEYGTSDDGNTLLTDHLGDASWGDLTSNHVYPSVTEPDRDNGLHQDAMNSLTLVSADIVLV